ncbi:hypothetical protein [Natrinema salsiterrestre]|uniref:Uncharacterized protein n=1 Tax=Natrinema salsiterrestre TaxID=2950540 RepID=A0A9Q4L7E5_9EURY|nr:hypothetical protein [Natrinema salsiterrestre]MDF9748303.1 hypothetical protein [Natrinema salsiterrestre]
METEIALALLQIIGLILPVTLLTARFLLNQSNSQNLSLQGDRVFTSGRKIAIWLLGSIAFLVIAALLALGQLLSTIWGTSYASAAVIATMVAFLSFLLPIYWLRDEFEIPVAGNS